MCRPAHIPGGMNTLVYPCYKRVPMGSTHSADIAMAVMRQCLVRRTISARCRLPPVELLWLNWPTSNRQVFVVWEFFSGTHRWSTAFALHDLKKALEAQGYEVEGDESWTVLRPLDILFSHKADLLNPVVRRFIAGV